MTVTHSDARHYSVQEKLRWLEPNPNLPEHLRTIAVLFLDLADNLLDEIDDNPQLSLALQHLIDAKDCAVRAKIASMDSVPG